MELPKIKAVLFTGKTYKDGTRPIMVRITQNRKQIYKAVGHSVLPDAWDEDTQRVYEKKPQITQRQERQLNPTKVHELKERYKHAIVLHNALTINSDIETKLAEVSGISNKLKVNEESLDIKNIKAKLTPVTFGDRNKSLLVYGNELRDKLKEAGSIGTYKNYKTILFKLGEYLVGKDLLFSDLTPTFLKDYQVHLKSLNNKATTINKNFKVIRTIYYSAISEELITAEKNPFFVFKLKTEKSAKKNRLTIEEIVQLEKMELKANTGAWHARNFFLFSFYCAGIRASDVLLLKWVNITPDNRLDYRMEKTGTFKSISLLPKARAILDLYKRDENISNPYVFPYVDPTVNEDDSLALFNQVSSGTAYVNKCLKLVAKEAGLEKNLSTHIARHSFSDIARKRKTSIYDISKMLGHSSIKITEAYLASFDIDSQDEAMKAILDF